MFFLLTYLKIFKHIYTCPPYILSSIYSVTYFNIYYKMLRHIMTYTNYTCKYNLFHHIYEISMIYLIIYEIDLNMLYHIRILYILICMVSINVYNIFLYNYKCNIFHLFWIYKEHIILEIVFCNLVFWN